MATQFSINDGKPWKSRFFTIWSGQAVSILGSQLVSFALIWYLTVRTESATVLAMASLVAMLPGIILGPVIGPLVDRWHRKITMLASDSLVAIATLALAALFAIGEPEVWQIFVLLFVRAIGGAFHAPSMSASTSLMVPIERLANVQGLNQMLNGGLNVFSAPLGALLLGVLPIQSILLIDVASAGLAIVPLLFFSIPQPDRSTSEKMSGEKPSLKSEIIAGFRYVSSWKGLMILLIMSTIINFLISPAFTLLPLLVKDYFGREVGDLAKVEALFGAGAIAGGILLGVWGGFKRKMHTAMVSLLIFGAALFLIASTQVDNFNQLLYLFIIVGVALPLMNGSISGVMQAKVAPDMQGRVFTLTGTISGAMIPIGLMIAGPVADKFGIQLWFFIGGAICILIAIFGFMSAELKDFEDRDMESLNDKEDNSIILVEPVTTD